MNLYPFRETVAKGGDFETCIENIDIGGPAMVRSAAKNHDFVAVVTDPAQYDDLLAEIKQTAAPPHSIPAKNSRQPPMRIPELMMPPSAAGSPRSWAKNIPKR